jgi:hypothetical protein
MERIIDLDAIFRRQELIEIDFFLPDFYSACSLKQQSAVDMWLHSDTLAWFLANQPGSFSLMLCAQQIINTIILESQTEMCKCFID